MPIGTDGARVKPKSLNGHLTESLAQKQTVWRLVELVVNQTPIYRWGKGDGGGCKNFLEPLSSCLSRQNLAGGKTGKRINEKLIQIKLKELPW